MQAGGGFSARESQLAEEGIYSHAFGQSGSLTESGNIRNMTYGGVGFWRRRAHTFLMEGSEATG